MTTFGKHSIHVLKTVFAWTRQDIILLTYYNRQ